MNVRWIRARGCERIQNLIYKKPKNPKKSKNPPQKQVYLTNFTHIPRYFAHFLGAGRNTPAAAPRQARPGCG
jgi:hypothetical protein